MATVRIPRSDIRKLDIVCKSMTADEVRKKYKPDFFMNLALYDTLSGKNITHLEDENIKSGYLFTDEGMGLTGAKNLIWTTKEKAFSSNLIKDYVSGSPILVKNGKVKIDWGNKVSSQVKNPRNRAILGMNDNEIILISINTSIALDSAAKTAVLNGCRYAINVDGGGSVHLEDRGKIHTLSKRRNASWIMGWYEDRSNQPGVYIVQKGDTLSAIAKKHGTTYQALARKNDIKPPYIILAGQQIEI